MHIKRYSFFDYDILGPILRSKGPIANCLAEDWIEDRHRPRGGLWGQCSANWLCTESNNHCVLHLLELINLVLAGEQFPDMPCMKKVDKDK